MYRMTRVTVVVCVLFVTAPAWAQRKGGSSSTAVRGVTRAAPPPAVRSPGPVMRSPSPAPMTQAAPMHAPPIHNPAPIVRGPAGSRAYLPPRPAREIPTRLGPRHFEPVPPPSYVPGSHRFTGYTGGRHVTYAYGSYYPHLVVYPIGGYYPVYYQSYPWESYAAPEMEGLAVDDGYLELHVLPDDEIAIDGRAAGSGFADGQRLTLPSGYHWVEVARDGFRSEVYNVSIAPGRVYPLRAQLAPLPAEADQAPPAPRAMPEKGSGTLSLRVGMDGARVFVDGEAWGAARPDAAGFMVLPAGDHAVRIEWPDGRTTITNVHLHDGDRIPLDLSPGQ